MLYEAYEKKIMRIAGVRDAIVKRKFLIIGIFAFLMLLLSALLFMRGIIIEDVSCADRVTYGDTFECSSAALLGDTAYEYSADGENWTDERPTLPGNYFVRAVSRRTFGIPNYGEPRAFAIEKRAATVAIADATVYYGDLPRVAAANLANGDVLAAAPVTLADHRAAATSAEITADGVRIANADGEDVTAAYEITAHARDIKILARPVTVAITGAEKIYDGTPLTCAQWSVTCGSPAYDDEIAVEVVGGITDVGSALNAANVRFYAGGADVTDRYSVTVDAGRLTVHKRAVTLRSRDAAKIYDGTPLFNDAFDLTSGSCAHGQTVSVASHTEFADAGEKANELGYTIKDACGRDVTANYEITAETGTLSVAKRQITLASDSAAKVYDGAPLICDSFGLIRGSYAGGQTAVVTARSELTDAGETVNELTYGITAGGRDVTDNYEITTHSGTLTVTKRRVSIRSHDAYKMYDGEPLFSDGYFVTVGSFAENQTAKVLERTQITFAGSAPNEHVYAITDDGVNDFTDNYEIFEESGTLTVAPRQIVVRAGSAEKIYDGAPLTCETVSADIVAGHKITARTLGARTDVGTSDNTVGGIDTVKITDGDGNDVMANYEITGLAAGTLTVRPRAVTVTADSATKVYDGEPLTCATVKADNLVFGHKVQAATEGSRTEAGVSANTVSGKLTITDSEGNDITQNYDIMTVPGTLTVTPRPITLSSHSAEKIYDAKELSCRTFDLIGGSLVKGHFAEVIDGATITDVGSKPNVLTYAIYDEQRNAVTNNYAITKADGTLTVTPREIVLSSCSAEKVYDGTPLYCDKFTFPDEDRLPLTGHYVTVADYTTLTDAGCVENFQTYRIDAGGKDVTGNYKIVAERGTLTVHRREITVRADSATKPYDGTPLKCGTVSADDLVAGHRVSGKTVGSQTEIGASPNVIKDANSVIITDASGKIVTNNYAVALEPGTLTVTEDIMNGGGDGGSGGDGEGGGSGEGGGGNGDATGIDRSGNISTGFGGGFGAGGGKDNVFLYVLGQRDGPVYLRDLNFGNYTYYGWTQATASQYVGASNPLYYVNDALTSYGYSNTTIKIQPLYDGLPAFMPYYAAYGGTAGNDVHVGTQSGNKNDVYSFTYVPYDYFESGLVYTVSPYEPAYREFVNAHYLTVPQSTRNVMLRLARENGLYVSGNILETLAGVRDYIKNAATYDMAFEIPASAEDVIVYFLTQGKRGVCQHFASAATLMFRSLGIPARYVTGFSAFTTAGQWTEVKGSTAHAWVEVYVDGAGWLPLEVTPGGAGGGGGTDDVPAGKVLVKPADFSVIYDGKEHTAYDGGCVPTLYKSCEDIFGRGTHCTFNVKGSRTAIGVGEIFVEDLRVYNASGADITDKFDILYRPGKLIVMPVPVTVMPYSLSKEYDGTPLICGSDEFYVVDDLLLRGHRIEAEAQGSQTVAGEGKSTVTKVRVYDENGVDVTVIYNVRFGSAPLIVEKRAVSFSSITAEKEYDGTALTAFGIRITGGSLADGHRYDYTSSGMQTTAGTSENTFENVQIYDAAFNNVTANYDITCVYGTLTVKAREITFRSADGSKPYDGTPLSADGYEIVRGSLATGHRAYVDTTGSQTAKGDSLNYMTVRIKDTEGNDVTDNYNIKEEYGTLTVK